MEVSAFTETTKTWIEKKVFFLFSREQQQYSWNGHNQTKIDIWKKQGKSNQFKNGGGGNIFLLLRGVSG